MSLSRILAEQKEYGAFRSVFLFFTIVCLTVISVTAVLAQETIPGAEQTNSLAVARTWQVLLHYRQRGERFESLVDDPDFFLSPQGKFDPHSEIIADLQGLLAPVINDDDHFRCRFPARSEWLIESLHLNELTLPQPLCGKLQEALTAVDPRTVVLVFPAAHNNGPASMFGHTLLRIGSSYQSSLLSSAINYAAHDTDSNGLLYAFKGIFGFYPGYFSLLPYHQKLNDYSSVEHRDIWEYSLNLTDEEARRLVLHSWELRAIASDYYFFDENCSFMLLFLLESARPELRLAERYWERPTFWVIPVDTIASIRRAGLISGVTYRPAQATRIRHRASLLSKEEQKRALAVAMQRVPAASLKLETAEKERQVLDLAAEYVQYRYSRQELTPEEFRPQFLSILKVRSQLGPGEIDTEKVPEPEQPESGHEAGKISLGGGNDGYGPYLEGGWRPAYHDLLDPDEGYTRGAQINFFALKGRYQLQEHKLQLQNFIPIDILSLAPRDLFFHPVSWKVKVGIDRLRLADGAEPLGFRLNTGGGLAWDMESAGLCYLMAEGEVNGSDRFREKGEIAAGASAGVITQFSRDWKGHLSAKTLSYLPDSHNLYQIRFEQNIRLSPRAGITLRAEWEENYRHPSLGANATLNYYFF